MKTSLEHEAGSQYDRTRPPYIERVATINSYFQTRDRDLIQTRARLDSVVAQVCQQDRTAGPDPTGDRLTHRSRSDDNNNLVHEPSTLKDRRSV